MKAKFIKYNDLDLISELSNIYSEYWYSDTDSVELRIETNEDTIDILKKYIPNLKVDDEDYIILWK